MIVIVLGRGPTRFRELRSTVEGISGKVLTETLRDLERDGIVSRHAYAEVPPSVEYALTDLGHTLHAPLRALGDWAEAHITYVIEARDRYDTEHG